MYIDFTKLQLTESRINEIIGELTFEGEKIKEIIKQMQINGYSQKRVNDLKIILEKLLQQTLIAIKMREAVKRIATNYTGSEKRMLSFIDEGKVEKQTYKYCTYFKDNIDFDWSIK